jgi:hypothetical protein
VLGLLGSAAAGANFALALIDLADCVEQNGQPEMARTLRDTAQKVQDELARLEALARSKGLAVGTP